MLLTGPYTDLSTRNNSLLHQGFDYHGHVMERSLSKSMINTNDNVTNFIYQIDPVVCELIDSVKHIKEFANLAIERNNRNFN